MTQGQDKFGKFFVSDLDGMRRVIYETTDRKAADRFANDAISRSAQAVSFRHVGLTTIVSTSFPTNSKG